MSSKSRAKSTSKGSSKGRATSPGRAQPKKAGSRRPAADGPTSRSREPAAGDARAPGLDVKAVDRLVARANDAIPKGRVRSAFSGTTPLSPNMVTVLGALPGVVIVGIGVATHQPLLLAVALAAMVVAILVLMRLVNATCVVAETPTELVVLRNRSDGLEPRARGPVELRLLPYRDRRWAHVEVAGERLWVSRRAFGVVLDRLAASGDEPVE